MVSSALNAAVGDVQPFVKYVPFGTSRTHADVTLRRRWALRL